MHILKIDIDLKANYLSRSILKGLSILLVTLLSSCQSNVRPVSLPDGLRAEKIVTSSHQHFLVKQFQPNRTLDLHVYIEGDGTPWIARYVMAKDPTPRYPLLLGAMQRDKQDSLYLGRPCYFNHVELGIADAHCSAILWTGARYSDAVVTSMVEALRTTLAASPLYARVTLIGHSGGGTLAMLMAARMPEVTQLVTIAANLDVDAWTEGHHFSRLNESLNPAEIIKVATPAKQLHFGGALDTQVPNAPVQKFLATINQQLIVFPEQDHGNWDFVWPKILQAIEAQSRAP